MRISDYFMIEFPSHERLMDGLEEGVLFDLLSTQYLNGFINYCEIVRGYMVNQYSDEPEWKKACEKLNSLLKGPHTDLSDGYPEIIILAENDNWWFYFDSDSDYTNCAIGKLSKEKYSKEEMLKALHEEALSHSDYYNHPGEIEVITKLNGWIIL